MEVYQKINKIGQGSFGTVFLVQHVQDFTTSGKPCIYVLKEIELDPKDPECRTKALAEVQFLRKLHNPYIISLVDCFEKKNTINIVMQYADGGDMDLRLKDRKARRANGDMEAYFEEKKVCSWLVQMCLGMKHIHDNKILHRDIKSSNVFLTEDDIIKIGDFGVARMLANTLDQAGTQIGTPYYLSPEICMNEEYNFKSDVWAMGVVMYEVASLRRPFEGNNILSLVKDIVTKHHPPPPECYSADLRDVLDGMLNKDPGERISIRKILKLPFLRSEVKKWKAYTPSTRSKGIDFTKLLNKGPSLATVSESPASGVQPPNSSSSSSSSSSPAKDPRSANLFQNNTDGSHVAAVLPPPKTAQSEEYYLVSTGLEFDGMGKSHTALRSSFNLFNVDDQQTPDMTLQETISQFQMSWKQTKKTNDIFDDVDNEKYSPTPSDVPSPASGASRQQSAVGSPNHSRGPSPQPPQAAGSSSIDGDDEGVSEPYGGSRERDRERDRDGGGKKISWGFDGNASLDQELKLGPQKMSASPPDFTPSEKARQRKLEAAEAKKRELIELGKQQYKEQKQRATKNRDTNMASNADPSKWEDHIAVQDGRGVGLESGRRRQYDTKYAKPSERTGIEDLDPLDTLVLESPHVKSREAPRRDLLPDDQQHETLFRRSPQQGRRSITPSQNTRIKKDPIFNFDAVDDQRRNSNDNNNNNNNYNNNHNNNHNNNDSTSSNSRSSSLFNSPGSDSSSPQTNNNNILPKPAAVPYQGRRSSPLPTSNSSTNINFPQTRVQATRNTRDTLDVLEPPTNPTSTRDQNKGEPRRRDKDNDVVEPRRRDTRDRDSERDSRESLSTNEPQSREGLASRNRQRRIQSAGTGEGSPPDNLSEKGQKAMLGGWDSLDSFRDVHTPTSKQESRVSRAREGVHTPLSRVRGEEGAREGGDRDRGSQAPAGRSRTEPVRTNERLGDNQRERDWGDEYTLHSRR